MGAKKTHSIFSASSSDRWLNHCAGSIRLSEKAPEEAESEAASEGTEAHACLEFMLKNKKHTTKWFRDEGGRPQLITDRWSKEMITHAVEAAQYIFNRVKEGAELLCETRSDLSYIHTGMYGTLDAAIVEDFGALWVFDYKYGMRIVEPTKNTQLIYYALGIAKQYRFNFSEVVFTIIQPRADHPEGTIRTWRCSVDFLKSYEKIFKEGVERCLAENAPLSAGDWCTFCKARSICPELSTHALKQAQIDFAPEIAKAPVISLPDPNAINPKKLSTILKGLDKIEEWAKGVRAHAFQVLNSGGMIPDFKLVQKRHTRKWAKLEEAEKAARTLFGEKAFDSFLFSPSQLEKVNLGKGNAKREKFIKQYSCSVSSGLSIAASDDPRPEHNMIAKDFANELLENYFPTNKTKPKKEK